MTFGENPVETNHEYLMSPPQSKNNESAQNQANDINSVEEAP
jgi:hypothetical protein